MIINLMKVVRYARVYKTCSFSNKVSNAWRVQGRFNEYFLLGLCPRDLKIVNRVLANLIWLELMIVLSGKRIKKSR